MHNCQLTKLRKSLLATFMGAVFGSAIVPVEVLSDQYVWGDLGGGSLTDPATCGTAPDPATVTFTMVDVSGAIVVNITNEQTLTCGTVSYDTQTQSGTAEIVRFLYFGLAADAKGVTIDAIPSPSNDLGIGNLFLGNMLFDWSTTIGIPVSTVWDAQGLLSEMDGTPTSFTLDSDGTIATATVFADTGGLPGVNGTNWSGGTINMGPQPLAMRRENTTNVPACTLGSCLNVNPSADITQSIVADTFDNTANNPTDPIGLSGNPMQDGPFTGFNANFDFNNLKLVSFTDETPPVVTLNGDSTIDIIVGSGPYVEQGATCKDSAPLDLYTYTVVISGDTVDTNTIGTYVIDYDCADDSGNSTSPDTTVSRTVNVKGADAVITLLADGNGDISPVTQECNVPPYTDAGATCSDPEDGAIVGTGDPLPNNLFSNDTSDVDSNIGILGTYSSIWSCQDNDFNLSTVIRDVDVVDTTLPILGTYSVPGTGFINSSGILILEVNDQSGYSNPTLSASDSCDTTLSAATTSSTVNFTLPDGVNVINSALLYTATDASLNSATDTLSVEVYRSEPVITLNGGKVTLNVGDTYVEQGMDIFDAQDGSIEDVMTSGVVTPTTPGTNPASPRDLTVTIDSSAVDTSTNGVYTVTYDVTDFDGNAAVQVEREVAVGVFAVDSNFTMLDSNGEVFGGTNDVIFQWDGVTYNSDESDTTFGIMTIESAAPWPFFGFVWTAHNIRVYEEGTYSFDTTCTAAQLNAGTTVCNNPLQPGQTEQFITMTVGAGQVGAHILFDWNTSVDIDVVNVWDVDGVWDQHEDDDPKNQLWLGQAFGSSGLPPDPDTTWKLVSTDVNGDAVNSSPMVDGPFQGFYANFNAGPAGSGELPPPYTDTAPDTKLGSGLFASPMNPWVLITVFMTLFGARRFSKNLNL